MAAGRRFIVVTSVHAGWRARGQLCLLMACPVLSSERSGQGSVEAHARGSRVQVRQTSGD